ncbi:MAG: hypothetical protein ACYDHZ_11980 [Dehalococcoidia bacterium]
MKKTALLLILAAIAMLILATTGCVKVAEPKTAVPPAAILWDVHTTAGVSSDGLPLWVRDGFEPSITRNIYVTARIDRAPEHTLVTAQWVLDRNYDERSIFITGKLFNKILFNDSCDVTGNRNIAFGHSAPASGWETGHYSVYLQLNGKKIAETSFVVQPLIIHFEYQGQLIRPYNGDISVPIQMIQFSWTPWENATNYEIDLARDPEFKQLVVSTTTRETPYICFGALDYDTSYYWRVKTLELNGHSIPTDWSYTSKFQTEPAPAP